MMHFRNLRNQFDFFIRSKIRIEKELPTHFQIPPAEKKFQEEIKEFLDKLGFKMLFRGNQKYVVCDVGAKNFSLAPVLDSFLKSVQCEGEIHGIEIDAFRRLSNFFSRADYARYFCGKTRNAHFHAIDFLDFQKTSDVVLMLNPFVSEGPLLAWGLPLKHLKPLQLFQHAYQLLREKRGTLVLSSPSEEEFEIASELAKQVGFSLGPLVTWQPKIESIQKKPRWGRLCSINR